MSRVLVDTGAWLALSDKDDQHHLRATSILEHLTTQRTRCVVSEWVLAESLTAIRFRVSHERAVRFGRAVLESRIAELVPYDDKVFQRAWDIFQRYEDKEFSFVDCTSFAIMEHLGLTVAFAFDRHFEQYGFQLLQATSR